MFKRFLSYYKPQMGLFVADTVCALVLAAIDLAFPIILRNLTGGLFTQGQAAIMQALGIHSQDNSELLQIHRDRSSADAGRKQWYSHWFSDAWL